MEKQKKNDSGITLVALVVSIIVMLVLAGVSLNATIGENGIVTRAQEAALQQRVAEELENLNLELTKLNVDTITTDETMAIQDIANYLVGKGTIDSFVKTSSEQIAAGIDTSTGNKYFFGVKGDNTYRITRGIDGLLSAELTTYTSGGDITGGYALVTAESFTSDDSLSAEEKGKFTITSDAEVVFMDTISGALSIYVKSGVHATVGIYANMELTNSNLSRAAIDIEKGGTLDLYIGEGVEVTVNSGYALAAERATSTNLIGGKGGYAGIHVPWIDDDNDGVRDAGEYATLNLFGSGKIEAIGGNASLGNDCLAGDIGGGGGGGAGAGIGGNGGAGGKPGRNWSIDGEGGDGENCGTINIHNKVTVVAKGGAGASSGINLRDNAGDSGSGTGAGGYPAAGIGGGGAGGGQGNYINGGGGYSGASCENDRKYAQYHNGGAETELTESTAKDGRGNKTYSDFDWQRDSAGGGYFTKGAIGPAVLSCAGDYGCNIGGEGAVVDAYGAGNPSGVERSGLNGKTGSGGYAGIGGIISVNNTSNENKATINAYNGNECTLPEFLEDDEGQITSNEDYYYKPLEIDIQDGMCRDLYFSNNTIQALIDKLSNKIGITTTGWTIATDSTQLVEHVIKDSDRTVLHPATSYGQGVGSGAGYIEVSNGTYTVYNEDNMGNFTTVYTGV